MSSNVLYMSFLAVTRSSYDSNTIGIVGLLPVLRMTSYFHIMEGMGNGQFPLDNSTSEISTTLLG